MRILILGLGKSGTTALLHKVAGGLPDCQAFSGGKPGKYLGDYENAVYKHTYSERKGKDFDLYREHLSEVPYDRKIWIARDCRDAAISEMLFRWHRGYVGNKKQYQAHLELVLKKEQDPRAIPFYEICRYAGHNGWPISKEEVAKNEHIRYKQMHDFVQGLDDDWFLFKYEQMIDNNFDDLNNYVGFEVQKGSQVPRAYGKVVRKKSYGDWRHWFTKADVELFKPAYLPYMQLIGYDCDDWELNQDPVIDPEFSSKYMQSLPGRVTKDTFLRYKERALRFFRK